ncbi:TetR/AcrR family transcriptional regulator [Nocardia sp. 2YAB30]|uniref:TetR/AcrR family transcriptional regulator n=1 Tax=unclassified Nocardia TaxID=2637762 RepID=UPI003F94F965
MGGERPLRADARRNREQILAAARAGFSSAGSGISLDEIARRAGVGAGTVHRHFPTKESLFEAVLVDHLRQLIDDATRALQSDDVEPAFFEFLLGMVGQAKTKQDLAEALARAEIAMSAQTRQVAAELRTVFADLLHRAQQAGAVRTDVDVDEVQAVAIAAVAVHRTGIPDPQRVAALICDCLRAPLPQ